MAKKLKFTRDYVLFGPKVRDFEKASDVNNVLAWTICQYSYPYDAYIEEKFVSVWLRDGEVGPNDPNNLDLIFIAKNQGYAEIVLRDHGDEAIYGGYLLWGEKAEVAEVTEEIVNGYSVINVVYSTGDVVRHEFILGYGYVDIDPDPIASLVRTKRGANAR